jgi:hypothetical protein
MAKPGYVVATDHLRIFSNGLDSVSQRCNQCKSQVPLFEGWDLVPGTGMPVVGLFFASNYNEYANVFKDALAAMAAALDVAHQKLNGVASSYAATEAAAAAKAAKLKAKLPSQATTTH